MSRLHDEQKTSELDDEGFTLSEAAFFEDVRSLAMKAMEAASADDQHRAYMGAAAALVDLASEAMAEISPGNRVAELCFLAQRLSGIATGETDES